MLSPDVATIIELKATRPSVQTGYFNFMAMGGIGLVAQLDGVDDLCLLTRSVLAVQHSFCLEQRGWLYNLSSVCYSSGGVFP